MPESTLALRVASLTTEIGLLVTELTKQTAWAASRLARANDWGRNTPQGSLSYTEYEAATAAIAGINERLVRLRAELDTAQQQLAERETAVTSLIAKGYTEEQANAQAEADANRRNLVTNVIKYTLIAVAVAVAIYGVVLFFRWKKGR